jgi:hypothetical protein
LSVAQNPNVATMAASSKRTIMGMSDFLSAT